MSAILWGDPQVLLVSCPPLPTLPNRTICQTHPIFTIFCLKGIGNMYMTTFFQLFQNNNNLKANNSNPPAEVYQMLCTWSLSKKVDYDASVFPQMPFSSLCWGSQLGGREWQSFCSCSPSPTSGSHHLVSCTPLGFMHVSYTKYNIGTGDTQMNRDSLCSETLYFKKSGKHIYVISAMIVHKKQ